MPPMIEKAIVALIEEALPGVAIFYDSAPAETPGPFVLYSASAEQDLYPDLEGRGTLFQYGVSVDVWSNDADQAMQMGHTLRQTLPEKTGNYGGSLVELIRTDGGFDTSEKIDGPSPTIWHQRNTDFLLTVSRERQQ